MNKYHIPLQPDTCYHVFNQAIGDDLLFRNDGNFEFFLRKYAVHTEGICDTYGYSLLPDHFHFAIKMKSNKECAKWFETKKHKVFDPSIDDVSDFLMERFSNLCNSYAKSYNKVFDRKGALFIDYMKRSEIIDENYLCDLIKYLHFNPVYHGICKDPMDWKWTSLHTFLAAKKTKIKRKEVLQMFGGLDKFKLAHVKLVSPLFEYEFP